MPSEGGDEEVSRIHLTTRSKVAGFKITEDLGLVFSTSDDGELHLEADFTQKAKALSADAVVGIKSHAYPQQSTGHPGIMFYGTAVKLELKK